MLTAQVGLLRSKLLRMPHMSYPSSPMLQMTVELHSQSLLCCRWITQLLKHSPIIPAFKSKLKHIGCRQSWVHTLRDKEIVIPKHVDTSENLADLFTKILPASSFLRLRNRIMRELPSTIK